MEPVRTLLWWNPGNDPEDLFWHETGQGARVVTVEELGTACRVEIRLPAPYLTCLLPPGVSFVECARLDEVAAALRRVLAGARSLRVMAVPSGGRPDLLAAAATAFEPDLMAGADPPKGFEAAAESHPRHRALLDRWRRDYDERVRRRRGSTRRYAPAELLTAGLPPGKPGTPLPRVRLPSHCSVRLLLPGCGGGPTRVVLHVSRARSAAVWDIRIDGRAIAAQHGLRQVECVATLGDAGFHSLAIAHGDADATDLLAVTIGPAATGS